MKWVLFIVFVGAGLGASAQNLETLSTAVVFLRHEYVQLDQTGTNEVWLKPRGQVPRPLMTSVTGSGLLLADGPTTALVTAKHVAKAFALNTGDFMVVGESNKPVVLNLPEFLHPVFTNWLHHELADVSMLVLQPPPASTAFLRRHCLPASDFLRPYTNSPPRSRSLAVLGFPLGYGWGEYAGDEFAPLVLRTSAASKFINSGTLFYLQDPGIAGYSGAPVFDLAEPIALARVSLGPNGIPACYGVVSFTRSDPTGGKLCGVVPTKFLVELLDRVVTGSSTQ